MDSLVTHIRLVADSCGESHFMPLEIGMITRTFAPPAPPFDVSELTEASMPNTAFERTGKHHQPELEGPLQ